MTISTPCRTARPSSSPTNSSTASPSASSCAMRAGWRERQVGVDRAGYLAFGIGPPAELPPHLTPIGDQVEAAPALEASRTPSPVASGNTLAARW